METKNILLIGVGGQGIILTSKILAAGLTKLGYDVKMSEIHGMSQRGGSVTTQIRYGERVFAPNIGPGEADIVVAFEKAEALRALPFLKKDGLMVVDDREIHPVTVLMGAAEYPKDAIESIKMTGARVKVISASRRAQELGNIRAQNICLLGALVRSLDISEINWTDLVGDMVPAKARVLNIDAFNAGWDMVL